MNEIPAEFGENYFADLFDTAKIANFAPDDRHNTWRARKCYTIIRTV